MTADRMTARNVLGRLHRHYVDPGKPFPGGVFLPEVTLGRQGGPRADAIYAGLSVSRGRLLYGHEIKVARSDWLHELDRPDKAEAWASQCHAWYVVAPDTKVVRPEELPHGWGLLTCDGPSKTRLTVNVKAEVDPSRTPSWEASLSLLSRQDTLRAQTLVEVRGAAREAAYADAERLVARQVEARVAQQGDVAAVRAELDRYKQVLGLRLVGDDRLYVDRGDEIGEVDAREVAALLTAHRDIRLARQALFGHYGGHELTGVRRNLDALQEALQVARGSTEALA